ncbi:uncharacterized protein LOC144322066 isoform X1 [Canis aureus]
MGSVPVRGLLVNRWNRRCALRSWPEKRDALNLVIPADKKDMGKLVDVYKVLKHLNQDGSLAASFVLQDPFIECSQLGKSDQCREEIPLMRRTSGSSFRSYERRGEIQNLMDKQFLQKPLQIPALSDPWRPGAGLLRVLEHHP